MKWHAHIAKVSITRACSHYQTSITRVFLLTLGNKKFLGFSAFYNDNFTPFKKKNKHYQIIDVTA